MYKIVFHGRKEPKCKQCELGRRVKKKIEISKTNLPPINNDLALSDEVFRSRKQVLDKTTGPTPLTYYNYLIEISIEGLPPIRAELDTDSQASLVSQTCPKKVFDKASEVSEKGFFPVVVARSEDCTVFLQCEMLCPDLAIDVKKGE